MQIQLDIFFTQLHDLVGPFGLHRKNRYGREPHHMFRNAPHEYVAKSASPVGGHDDKVGLKLRDSLQDLLDGRSAGDFEPEALGDNRVFHEKMNDGLSGFEFSIIGLCSSLHSRVNDMQNKDFPVEKPGNLFGVPEGFEGELG